MFSGTRILRASVHVLTKVLLISVLFPHIPILTLISGSSHYPATFTAMSITDGVPQLPMEWPGEPHVRER